MTTVEKFKALFGEYVDEFKVIADCSLAECEKFAKALKISKQEIQKTLASIGDKSDLYDIALGVSIVHKVRERKFSR